MHDVFSVRVSFNQPILFSMTAAWIALNAIRGLGPVRIKALLDAYGTPEEIFKQPPQEIARRAGISPQALAPSVRQELFEEAQRQIDKCDKSGVAILTIAHEEYPPQLREVFAPPPVLFIKGQASAFRRHAVALVGTRHPTPYGRSAAAVLTKGLTANGMAVVSGLARGIDTVVHQACVDNNGITIGVLGCGIDRIYPPENARLAHAIIARGAIVSEFPLGTQPESFNFPRRNRIISGLSAGVVVVESGERGGALITAQYALQQNREVFAVPGSIFSEKSAGAHALIKNGATPVRTASEIIEAIASIKHARLTPDGPSAAVQPPLELLAQQERLLLEALDGAALRPDQIAEKAGMDVGELSSVLLNLELRGMIRLRAGSRYERISAL